MGSLGHSCLSLVVDSIDVLEVEGVSESSSGDCELEHIEDVGQLLLLVLGIVQGELGVDSTLEKLLVVVQCEGC